MKIKTAALSLCLIAIANPVYAETLVKQKVYQGKIGNQNVVFELLEAKDAANKNIILGRYFYEQHRIPIQIIGEKNAQTHALKETKEDYSYINCEFVAKIELKESGSKISGKWTNIENSKKTYPVNLSLISQRSATIAEAPKKGFQLQDAFKDDNPLENPFLKKQLDGPKTFGKKTMKNGVGYVDVTDKYTNVSYINLTDYKDPKSKNKIANLLEIKRLELISYALDCKSFAQDGMMGTGTFGGFDEYQSKVKYADDKLLVITESGSTYCGGAHPNNSYQNIVYDLVRGEEFDKMRYFKFYKYFESNYDFEKTPAFDDFLKTLTIDSKNYLGSRDDKERFDECLIDDFGQEYKINFNEKGVVFSLENLPHVIGACMDDYFLVPYNEMVPLMTDEGKKFFADKMH